MRQTFAALLFAACAHPVPPAAPVSPTASERLAHLFDEAWEARLADDPALAALEGRKTRYGEWPPYTLASVEQAAAREAAFLERIQAIDPASLSPQERLSVGLYAHEVAERQEAVRWWRHAYPVEQMGGMHAWPASFLFDVHDVDDVPDAEAYVSRLNGLGPLLDQVVAEMETREAMGVLPPRFVFPMVLDDCRNLLTGAPFDDGPDSPILGDLRAKVEKLPEADRARILAEGEAALTGVVGPAYGRLIATLERQHAVATDDDGAWKLPDAAAFYAFRLRSTTTTDLDADAIHTLGLSEVARIHGEMDALRAKIGFEGDLPAFFDHLRASPDFYYPDTEEGRAAYLAEATAVIDDMRERLPTLFLTLPKAPLVVKAVEPYREKSAGKAFYNVGTPDGDRPGIYYANLVSMSDMPTYQLQALAYHEGIPGHHMQLSIAQELDGLPEIRMRADRTAYIEGWGLYSEKLPGEMGLYTDPYADFGRLAMGLWRACRLVVDTGIHHHRWTRAQAIAYLVENTPNPEGDARRAIDRYIVWPGQATAYSIGMLRILELRERARAELGEDFDLREFHDVVLTNGPVPLDVLGTIVDGWVARRRGDG